MDFLRFESLIGKNNFELIKNLTIVIVGVGGVGGYCVESLARSGVGKLILIDYDKVDITNKNRQIIADDSTINQKKVEAFKQRISLINKDCKVITIDDFLSPDNIDLILKYNPDFIIDCCDSIKTKEALISFSLDNNIKLISSMGTGKRLDASKLEVTTLDKTSYDPIAKILRKYCRDNRINQKKVHVLYSSEKPVSGDYPYITSCSYVPGTAGLLITSYVINDVLCNKK